MKKNTHFQLHFRICLTAFLFSNLYMAGCTPRTPALPAALVLYNWDDYMPQFLLDAFEKEYGMKVIVQIYDTQDEAFRNISDGSLAFDVAVVENDLLPSLVEDNLLAEIDYRNIPNFENISADFRGLAYDPGNRHSVPYNWGTSGLIVRSDLVEEPVTGWADLWDPRYAGRVGIRNDSIEMIAIALRTLGFPLNSEDPAQLEAALSRLVELKKNAVYVPADSQGFLESLENGKVAIVQGWNGDALLARERCPDIQYILPREGTMLWGDSLVISAASPNQYAPELFLNFVLRPQMSAQVVETYYYPSANQTAHQYIDPEILNDPIVYPPLEYLQANDFYAPLSDQGEELYAEIWERYLKASP